MKNFYMAIMCTIVPYNISSAMDQEYQGAKIQSFSAIKNTMAITTHHGAPETVMREVIQLASSRTLNERLKNIGHKHFVEQTQIDIMFGGLKDSFENILYKLEDIIFRYEETCRKKIDSNKVPNHLTMIQPKILSALLEEHSSILCLWREYEKSFAKTNPTLLLLEEKGFIE